eukprot:TRINITY_DN4781_c0_g1_i1.p1 TRINITY_DN4781_c0_g1~~TRINITY_DN4781_c0_g1_i1.p1  ORF type:complete len:127 (-),score=11.29 TRINITY_DN4781_c0_g1_i1:27-407(-)
MTTNPAKGGAMIGGYATFTQRIIIFSLRFTHHYALNLQCLLFLHFAESEAKRAKHRREEETTYTTIHHLHFHPISLSSNGASIFHLFLRLYLPTMHNISRRQLFHASHTPPVPSPPPILSATHCFF